MRWALLEEDDDTRQWESQIAAARESEAVRAHEFLRVPTAEWESLLARTDYDAVLMGRRSEESLRAEQLRKLVSAGTTLVVFHPPVEVLTAYELEMIRRDRGGILLPFAPGWRHPAWDRLRQLILDGESSPIGRVEQVSIERFLSDRHLKTVSTQVSRDIDVLRRLLGVITSVHTVGVPRGEDSWSSYTVHFASEGGCAATWSIAAATPGTQARVNLAGNRGSASLVIPSDLAGAAWELLIHPAGDRAEERVTFPEFNEAEALEADIARARKGQPVVPSWSDACLDLEITESVEKSLRRKRAIDLYTAERSEEKTFKGFMAAAGCLILVVILLAFLGFALWDGIRAPFREGIVSPQNLDARSSRDSGWPLWVRLWPVYPLVAFLILQILLFITRGSKGDSKAG